MTGFEEFKKTNDQRLAEIEKKGAADPLTLEKLARIEADLARTEEVNQKLVAIEREAKAAIEREQELRETIDRLELKLKRPLVGGEDLKLQRKATHATWARAAVLSSMGGTPLSDEHRKVLADVEAECKSLSIQNDTTGGYLAPPEYVKEIIKGITEMSPVRSLVRVRSTGAKSIMLPKRTGQFAARRVGEQETRTETTGLTWGMIEIVAPEMCALIDISRQNLEDSAFDLEAELRLEADEQFAVKEGAEVVAGTGVNQCEGFLDQYRRRLDRVGVGGHRGRRQRPGRRHSDAEARDQDGLYAQCHLGAEPHHARFGPQAQGWQQAVHLDARDCAR